MSAKKWLESPDKDYWQGVELCHRSGISKTLLDLFKQGPGVFTKKKLHQEMVKLASKEPTSPPVQPGANNPVTVPKGRPQKNELPQELHLAYDRQSELYSLVNHLHPLLDITYQVDRGKCHKMVQALLDAWREIDDIYRLFDYWTAHKEILPNKYQPDGPSQTLDIIELVRERDTHERYIARNRNNPAKAIEVQQRLKRKREIQAYLKNR